MTRRALPISPYRALHPRSFQVAELAVPLRLRRRPPLLARLQLGLRVLELRLDEGSLSTLVHYEQTRQALGALVHYEHAVI